MERNDFVQVFSPLLAAFRQSFDAPQWKVYHSVLDKVPAPLLEAAISDAVQLDTPFIPRPGQLLAMCERRRQALLSAHPFDGCAECEDRRGWRQIEIDGVSRVERCPCRERWLAKLQGLGVTTVPLMLPAAREEMAS